MIRKIVNVLVVIAVVYVIYEMNRHFYWQGWADAYVLCRSIIDTHVEPDKYAACRERLNFERDRNDALVRDLIEAEKRVNSLKSITTDSCEEIIKKGVHDRYINKERYINIYIDRNRGSNWQSQNLLTD